MHHQCILCQSEDVTYNIKSADGRQHCLCGHCSLIFTVEQHRPNADVERERYLSHNNNIQNKGYVDFLRKAISPALPWLNKGMQGLDFGCGPEPVLASLLAQEGISCVYYDPYFFPHLDSNRRNDFIFSTECFEHFFNPDKEIRFIDTMLKSNGYLIIMTELWTDLNRFPAWYYARDISHVVFYHKKTMEYIAAKINYSIIYSDEKRVLILQKNP